MSEVMKDALMKAFSTTKKKFKEGDLVVFKHTPRIFTYLEEQTGFKLICKVEKVGNLSYDLKINISEEDIEKYKKIVAESFTWCEPSFECWERRKNKNSPYSEKEILLADTIMSSFIIRQQDEEDLVKYQG